MKFLRPLLILAFFLLVQAGALAHTVGHRHDPADVSVSQECALCLAGHDLDHALPAPPPVWAVSCAVYSALCFEPLFHVEARRGFQRARAPPFLPT